VISSVAREDLSDVLSEFARTMVTDFPIQGILDHLVERIVEILPVTAAGVTLIAPGSDPHYIAASNDAALRFEQLQTELGEGPCVDAYHTGIAIAAPDLSRETRFRKFSPRAVDAGLAAVFTFPLHRGTLRLGALDLYRDTPGPLSPESMRAAETLADVAAAYIVNAQAREDLQDSSDRSREAALHDALTGLPNRVLLLERIEHAFQRAQRSNKTLAVFFVDLNRFKEVNDSYGHDVGDELLVAVTARLTDILRPGDTLARLSGDEFVILCEDFDDATQAEPVARRIDAALAPRFVVAGVELTMTASVGIAFTGHGSESPEQLIQHADLAMYHQKRQHSGRQIFDLRGQDLAQYQAELHRTLPRAAARGELQLHYQPIVSTDDGRITGVEALLRWNHPDRGLIPPAIVIPVAERSGAMIEIGRWVLDQACRDRSGWQDAPSEIGVSVNVSAHQLMSAGFVYSVAAALDATSTEPGLLTLELTETVFVRDPERALVVLDSLRALGVKLALDDFGTGFSSLNYLTRFPVDTVKIDRSFIATLTETGSFTIVAAIIELAHALEMTVVSEGVESVEEQRELARLRSDFCQGYYFARPAPVAELTALMRQTTDASMPRLPALNGSM
jgi:diguanylate cyclase (GGDEF)-like protein